MTPSDRQLKTTRGSALTVRTYGDGDRAGKLPVLALHGWLDNAASFDLLAPRLPSLDVVALDLPGHGFSAHRSVDAVYALIDWVPDVLRAADALGWDRFVLLGHSLGGSVACLTTGTVPQRIAGLLLIDAVGALTASPEEAPARLELHLEAVKRLEGKPAPLYPTVDDALRARRKAGRFDTEAGIRGVVERGLKAVKVDSREGFAWRSDPRLTLPSPHRLTVPHVVAFLERVACPTLVVRPDGGLPFEAQAMQRYRSAIKDLEIKDVEGGHHVHLDRPEVVAAVIEEFVARKWGQPPIWKP